jgi:hypothetical protein
MSSTVGTMMTLRRAVVFPLGDGVLAISALAVGCRSRKTETVEILDILSGYDHP